MIAAVQGNDWPESLGLIRLGPNDTLRAGLTGEGTSPLFLSEFARNAANGHLQVALDPLLHLGRAVPMAEGEAAVDLGFVRIFRGEEFIKLFLRIDRARVLVPELQGPVIKRLLDRVQGLDRRADKFANRSKGL